MADYFENIFEFSVKMQQFPANQLGYIHHIIVPDEIALAAYHNNARRVQIFVGEKGPVPAAIVKSKDYYYILFSKQLIKTFGLTTNSTFIIRLMPDKSELGMEIPAEMKLIFDVDEEADQYFRKLTPGKQRSLIYLISKIKSENIRIQKSMVIIDHIKINKGKIDFRMLNEAFRNN